MRLSSQALLPMFPLSFSCNGLGDADTKDLRVYAGESGPGGGTTARLLTDIWERWPAWSSPRPKANRPQSLQILPLSLKGSRLGMEWCPD